MPYVSKKRRAISELKRQTALKRWRMEDDGSEPGTSSQPPPPPPPPREPTAADFRHSLLPEHLRQTDSFDDDSALVVISVKRLKVLLSLVVCSCGHIFCLYIYIYIYINKRGPGALMEEED